MEAADDGLAGVSQVAGEVVRLDDPFAGALDRTEQGNPLLP
jgi:hypothetical protein